MIRLLRTVAEGWIEGWVIAYALAGPRRDPRVEAEVAFHMGLWQGVKALRLVGLTTEEAGLALRDAASALERALTERRDSGRADDRLPSVAGGLVPKEDIDP